MNPKQTPTFVVIGQPNEGKTTVLATLTENDTAEIGPIPGNTQRCVRYPYKVDDRDIFFFYDTPGFQRPGKMLEWFSEQDDNAPDLAKRFLAEFAHDKVFQAECEILKPIVNGAAVLYIADASRRVGKADRQALEILRKCGNPRIGIINSRDKAKAHFEEWKQFMRKDFNHCREFNGHRASFRDRKELLEAVGAVVSEWSAPMKGVLAALVSDWDARLAQVADMIIDLLIKVLTAQEKVIVQKPGEEDHAKKKAKGKLEEKIRDFERSCRRKILKVFKHSEDHWRPSKLEKMDLFSDETWELFGLSKLQLAFVAGIVGGSVGAVIGFKIDVLALGSTGGLGTAIGAGIGGIVGGVVAWCGADQAVDFKVPLALRLTLGRKKFGGRTSIAKIKSESNLPWVLINRSLTYAEEASHWAHGKNAASELQLAEERKNRLSEKSELETISKFIRQVCGDKKDQTKYQDAKKSVRLLLVSKLKQLTE
jgi:GTP-binding protein EngB required for normal cell division